jgi:hypothetical protein
VILPAGAATSNARFGILIFLLAAVALGFFLPSLTLAGVPLSRWPEFVLLAACGAVIVIGPVLARVDDLPTKMAIAVIVSVMIAGIGYVNRGYFDQTPLLYAMIVAAMAVFHGLAPALLSVAIGAVLMPGVVQASLATNITDYVYAAIYLFGAALLPWTAVRVANRRAMAVQDELRSTVQTRYEAVRILARAAEAKDEFTGDHVAQVGDLSRELAEAVGMDAAAVDGLGYAAMLHDVGKLHVPDRILLKPGPLDPEEWEIIRRHTTIGASIMGHSSGFELARTVARSHHENWDGSGYPDGLRALSIPLAARIVRLVDVFDALRSRRPYKPAWPFERCLEELVAGAGRQFDPDLAPTFVALLERLQQAGQLTVMPKLGHASAWRFGTDGEAAPALGLVPDEGARTAA